MKKHLLYAVIVSLFLAACAEQKTKNHTQKNSDSISRTWQLNGFVHPESIVFSEMDSCLYISNIGNNDSLADGFISKVSLKGTFIDTMWSKGLYSPKGIHIANEALYVNDLKTLKKIDLHSGAIVASFSFESIGMLNDVTSDETGNIYSSDMVHSAIYRLDTAGTFEKIYQNDTLHHPNGLYYRNNMLYIGSWGSFDNNNPDEDSVGHFFMLDLRSQKLRAITTQKTGKLDGIQTKDDAFLVSAWKAGKIFLITEDGDVELILNSETSLGDILYREKEHMIYLPLNFQNKVEAWSL